MYILSHKSDGFPTWILTVFVVLHRRLLPVSFLHNMVWSLVMNTETFLNSKTEPTDSKYVECSVEPKKTGERRDLNLKWDPDSRKCHVISMGKLLRGFFDVSKIVCTYVQFLQTVFWGVCQSKGRDFLAKKKFKVNGLT